MWDGEIASGFKVSRRALSF